MNSHTWCIGLDVHMRSFILGDTQRPSGHSPVNSAVVTLLELRDWTRWPPEVPSNLSPSVALCDICYKQILRW